MSDAETTTGGSAGTSSGRTGRVGVGVIGAGVISGTYLENMTRFPDLEVLFVADLIADLDSALAAVTAHLDGAAGAESAS